MGRSKNQKLKLFYLAKIFWEETDENHYLTMGEIIKNLESYDISAERKSVYSDIQALQDLGMDILADHNGREHYYYLASRDFELAELKLLVDAVQSSRFISQSKSEVLIKKLEKLTSRHDAEQLQHQLLLSSRVKTMNKSVFINIDTIQRALRNNQQICFKYFTLGMNKKKNYHRNKGLYKVSPWYLWFRDENYYLVAYDSETDETRHFRVDRMEEVDTLDAKREGKEKLEDASYYTKQIFGMYYGETVNVTLEGEASMAGVLFDRFGSDIIMIPVDKDHFRTHVDVAVSPQFLGWVAGLNGHVRITAPDSVVKEMQDFAGRILEAHTPAAEDPQQPSDS